MSSSKRPSSAPKPPTSLSSTVVIADTAVLTGTKQITIRDGTIIHPRANLSSVYGPLAIGNACIISERTHIGLQSSATEQSQGVVIEDAVVIEVNAVVEARKVGLGCIIETGARIGKGAILGKHCKIGPMCWVEENEIVPDHTVIFSDNKRRIDVSDVDEMKLRLVSRQADVLRKLVVGNLAKWQ